jgi:hypothetical protein
LKLEAQKASVEKALATVLESRTAAQHATDHDRA